MNKPSPFKPRKAPKHKKHDAGTEVEFSSSSVEQPTGSLETPEDTNDISTPVEDTNAVEGTEDAQEPTGIEHLTRDETEEELDEDFSNDEILDQKNDRGLVEQESDIVAWEVVGLYDDNGKRFPPRVLRNSPPILTMRNENNEASFVLTKELAGHLNYITDAVYKGYFNVESKGIDEDKFSWRMRKSIPVLVAGVAIVLVYILANLL